MSMQATNIRHSLNISCALRAYPGSEFVAANTFAKKKKLEPNGINFSQGFSQKVVSFNKLFCI